MANPQEEIALQKWWRELKDGLQQGIAASPEDRREMLTAIRELEGKAEGPRALYTLVQNPVIDVLRQRNTVENRQGLSSLGLPQLTDDALLYRANRGMLVGPKPEEVIPKEMWWKGEALPADPIRLHNEPIADFNERASEARIRRDKNLGIYKQALAQTPGMTKVGGALSALASDISHDATRGLWWLINASQAVTNLTTEAAAGAANPDLFGAKPLNDLDFAEEQGLIRFKQPSEKKLDVIADEIMQRRDQEIDEWTPRAGGIPLEKMGTVEEFAKPEPITKEAARREAINEQRKNPKNFVAKSAGVKNVRGGFKQRRFNPNLVNVAAMLPAAFGINAGVGLLGGEDSGTIVPGTGRKQGYAAAIPSEDDPRVTDNLALEAGTKFFLGREGQLLPWNEGFQEERPDVSRKEYNQYKNYERRRDIDLNPFDDGVWNLGGVLKGNMNDDAIHGGEVQFLGKNIPVNEALIPTIGAMIGTTAGALLPNVRRIRKRRSNPNLKTHIPISKFKRNTDGSILRDASGAPQQEFFYKGDSNPERNEFGQKVLKDDYSYESVEDLGVNKYDDINSSRLTRLMGQLPEVSPRDASTGRIVPNPNLEDKQALKNIENFFLKKPETRADGTAVTSTDDLRRDRALGVMFGGGLAGLAAGQTVGGTIEDERRERNFESNNPGLDYEIYKANAKRLGERQRELNLTNPNRDKEKAESKTGFNNRAYQQSLMEETQKQQTAINTIADKYLRGMAQEKQDENKSRLDKIQAIEEEIFRNKNGDDEFPY